MSEDHGPSPDEMYRAVNADWLDAIEAGINPYTGRKMNRETTDETTDIIETIRDRRDRAIDAHGRTAAAMDVMHLSPFEQAVYVDAALERIDRLTAERDVAYAELSRVRYAIDRLTAERDAARKNESRWRERINAIIAIAESYESLAQNPAVETSVSQERLGFAQDIYQALGIGSEADHD